MLKNIAIPDVFDKKDCSELSNEEIAELHKNEILKTLNINNNRKSIALNTHIVILLEE